MKLTCIKRGRELNIIPFSIKTTTKNISVSIAAKKTIKINKRTFKALKVVRTSKYTENFVYRWWRKFNCERLHSWIENKFWRFPGNGCYGNQSQSLEVLSDSINCNNSCSFRKQDLIFKQACLVCFCVVLFNKLQFWHLAVAFSAFYRLYLEITLFCTKPSQQIIYCHVTKVKMLGVF